MKKIFRLSLVLALSCASLMYTGCTKDYEKDVEQIRKDLNDLKDGPVATNTADIKQLQSDLKDLQTSLEKSISDTKKELQAAIDKKASAEDLTKLTNRVVTLENAKTSVDSRVTTLETKVSNLEKNKLDVTTAASTYATIKALGEVSAELGNVETTVGGLETAVKALQDAKFQEQINAVKETADGAAAKLKTLLEETIPGIKTALDNRYTKGECDGKISNAIRELQTVLEAKILQDSTDIMKKLNELEEKHNNEISAVNGRVDTVILNFNEKIGALKDQVKAQSDSLKNIDSRTADAEEDIVSLFELSSALDAKIDTLEEVLVARFEANEAKIKVNADSVKVLNGLIDALDARVVDLEDEIGKTGEGIKARLEQCEEDIVALQEGLGFALCAISDLNERVNSISVLPTDTCELFKIIVGEKESYSLVANFRVEPKTAVDGVDARALQMFVKKGLQRTKAGQNGTNYPVKVVHVDKANGVLTLQANNLSKDICEGEFEDVRESNSGVFFALEYTGIDTVGTYTVCSEYAQSIAGEILDFNENFVWISADSIVTDGQGNPVTDLSLTPESKDYTKVDYKDSIKTFQPFTAFSVGIKNMGTDDFVTPEEFEEMFGIEVDVKYANATDSNHEPAATKITDEGEKKGLNGEVYFECTAPDSMKVHVGEITEAMDTVKVNNVQALMIRSTYEITLHNMPAQNITIHVPWNLQNYGTTGKAEKKNIGGCWKQAYEEGATGSNAAKFSPEDKATFTFGPWDDALKKYPLDLKIENFKFADTTQTFISFNYPMSSPANNFYFNFKVTASAKPSVDTVVRTITNQAVTFNNETVIELKNVIREFFIAEGQEDSLAAKFVEGLPKDQAAWSKLGSYVTASVWGGIGLKQEGVEGATVTRAGENYTITIPKGKLAYGQNCTFILTSGTNQGLNLVTKVVVSTIANPFGLVYTNYIKDQENDPNAEVRGHFINKQYTLEEMFFTKYLRLADATDSLAGEEGIENFFVKFSYEVEGDKEAGEAPNKDEFKGDKKGKLVYTEDYLSFSEHSGEYVIDQAEKLTWGTYRGRQVKLTADLILVNDANDTLKLDSKKFRFWTAKPNVFNTAGEFRDTRLAGQTKEFKLWANSKVYGVEEGVMVLTRNLVKTDGSFDPNYKYGTEGNDDNLQLSYDFENMDWTINGKKHVPVEGTDYNVVDNNKIQIIGDNAVGAVTIKIPATLKYFLDYNHVEKETKDVMIYLNQD